MGRLLALLTAALLAACAGEAPPAQNLLMVSLDTTRSDHLPPYGYPRPTMPRLADLAAGSAVFTQAFAQETNTNPSHASMFTGLYPHRHGNWENGQVLAAGHRTLAELLAGAGMRTGAFVGGITMLARLTGFERGFERYDDELADRRRRPAEETVDRALAWLATLGPEERFFCFVHFYDAHGPYEPPPSYRGLFVSEETPVRLRQVPRYQLRRGPGGAPEDRLAPYRDAYDATLRSMDDQLARLLAAVDLSRTAVLVLADHGETLGERYWGPDHGGQVFDEQIRIPMILALPGRPGRRVGELVETVDLLPTLLEALALPPQPEPLDGRSLLPLLGGEGGRPERRPVVFSAARPEDRRHADRGYRLDPTRRIVTVRSERWKLVRYPGAEEDYEELYDLAADPGERSAAAEGAPREALRRLLERWLAGGEARSAPADLSDEERDALRALGYL